MEIFRSKSALMPLNSLKCQAKSVNNLYKCLYHVQKSVVSVLSQEIPKWFPNVLRTFNLFIFYLGFLSRTFTIQRTARKGEFISLSLFYHFHQLDRHLDISRATTAESSPLHIASSRTRTGNLWFQSASC